MGVNQINILSFIKNKKIYSDNTLEKYNYLFDIFISSEAFNNHGNLPKWLDILDSLPDLNTDFLDVTSDSIEIGRTDEISNSQRTILKKKLLKLNPWRKGPFHLFGLHIDSEWRSEKKWNRIKNYLPNLMGKSIGDLGCSNGYYSYRLLNFNPKIIIGLDKTPLFIMQFLATKLYARNLQNIIILPTTAEDFVYKKFNFDLLLSMGILYHSKNSATHIEALNSLLKKNGTLFLETIISLTKDNLNITKGQTYAGMKNIGTIYTIDNLRKLMIENGFKNIECIDESFTNSSEQRSTEWMTGKSFKDFILPNGKTIEGFLPVCRAIFIAQKK
ncbi:MAG: tRNA 5-methoxyuridine(34)/uridine 5-oxyacetic acid(34) synthase CmoB [Gammaproteobacteria bacterium]|jgi:tRNA (mo5U34)-methyltransferase|nr:tRNA 5-methoxyuridine(34)/uridine 5-oxyacetic acid(34) synthase CmoB [Gammaproteobacteria bacterium]MBT7603801.1 tRNA 5-methoxyuridine(34)/uridine 5-oxyacetic acid(34) synthase CmoB [Gammaproteobacteria bacterium]